MKISTFHATFYAILCYFMGLQTTCMCSDSNLIVYIDSNHFNAHILIPNDSSAGRWSRSTAKTTFSGACDQILTT